MDTKPTVMLIIAKRLMTIFKVDTCRNATRLVDVQISSKLHSSRNKFYPVLPRAENNLKVVFYQIKGWGQNKCAYLAIILLAVRTLAQQGRIRANSWLFIR